MADEKMEPASLQDWFEINNLFTRYTTALDSGDVDAVADCFGENGILDSPLLGVFEGRDRIRTFAARTRTVSRERAAQFRHLVTNLKVETKDARARATCYFLDYLTSNGKTELLTPGVYHCDLSRTDGRWRFDMRRVTLDQEFPIEM